MLVLVLMNMFRRRVAVPSQARRGLAIMIQVEERAGEEVDVLFAIARRVDAVRRERDRRAR